MVLFNYSTKEITAKIVYYGPGLCGKTTNLQFVYDNLPATINKGRMLSLATKTDRTLFFDFLPIDLGTIRGLRTRLQLYTVPGQVFYNTTRKLVLKGADGVVFVADSQKRMLDANLESLRNLADNLAEHDMKLTEIPLIIQFNKRDLPDVATLDELNAALNKYNAPIYEAVATTGIGVHETLRAATRLVLNSLKERYAERREERVEPGVQAAALAAAQKTAKRTPAQADATDRATTQSLLRGDMPPAPIRASGPATTPMKRPAAPVPPPAAAPPAFDFMDLEEPAGTNDTLQDVPRVRPSFETRPSAEPLLPPEPDAAFEPVLELALDDDTPLEVADEAFELELDDAPPTATDDLGLSGIFDEPAGEPLVKDEEPSFGAQPHEPLAASYSGLEETQEQEPWSIPLDDDPLAAVPAAEPAQDDDPIPLLLDGDEPEQAQPIPDAAPVVEEPQIIPLARTDREEEPQVIALEDSHDDLLSLGLSAETERVNEPLPAGDVSAAVPVVSSRVVAVDAATAGQQEIHVPIELAIGGKSIRFDLRISLDLSHAGSRESMGGIEDQRR